MPSAEGLSMSNPMPPNTAWDAEEAFHLALGAMQSGQHHLAIMFLKHLLALEPRHAEGRYLLAAEHAQLGMFDRARTEMQQALELKPVLTMARFQLGLLHMAANDVGAARACFVELQSLPESDALRWCGTGLRALLDGANGECRQALTRAIELSAANPSLVQDMRRILDNLGTANAQAAAPQAAAAPAASAPAGGLYVSMYDRNAKG